MAKASVPIRVAAPGKAAPSAIMKTKNVIMIYPTENQELFEARREVESSKEAARHSNAVAQ